ncbi:MAG: DUF1549 domain-containing protein [Pirellulaceae bacterium]|nr:DUF1549 domain-containing protein [Pirellulaceae bacterium]
MISAIVLVLMIARPEVVADDNAIVFGRDIRPILAGHCFNCHGPDEASREADLRLDTEDGARRVLLAEGQTAALIERVTSDDHDLLMPPPSAKKPLTDAQITLLRRWVEADAPWGKHWAFEPLVAPPVPEIAALPNTGPTTEPNIGTHNPIDHFVQARLAARGATPSLKAERETLIRRASLDLIGLPPTPEEVDSFVADTSDDAWKKVVDRLLASPAYGERMAWSWLDAARYADSNGYQGDNERTMWPWRDWVTEAFNRNMPYDDFTVWQLAGDQLPDATFEQKLATGFARNHMINGEGGRIPEENRVEYVMDMTETAGTVWLGLTMNCCRCHDHKFDPLTQRDYYSLSAFFNQTPVDGSGGNPQTPPVLEAPSPAQRQQMAEIETQVAAVRATLQQREEELAESQGDWEHEIKATTDAGLDQRNESLLTILNTPVEQRTAEQRDQVWNAYSANDSAYVALRKAREDLEKSLQDLRRGLPKVMVMEDQSELRKTWVLTRGIYSKHGEEVAANVPAYLPPLPTGASVNRLALARWIVSDDNPLTARVTVNRIWQQFFGLGLVKTTEDFGVQGEIPLQQDLLDWLAVDFRQNGWDVKRLVKQIVTSHTYCQSSRIRMSDDEAENANQNGRGLSYEDDPENRYLSRGPRFRLPAWMIRDQALAASGLLVRDIGGPAVKGYQPAGVWEEATFGGKTYQQDHGAALYRRSLYTFWRRIIAPTMFFDNASRQTCTVKSYRTNTPLQALLTLNDVTFVEAARVLAERVLTTSIATDADRIDEVFRRLLARRASDSERDILLAAIGRSRDEFNADQDSATKLVSVGESKRNEQLEPVEHAVWTSMTLAVMNLDETLTKE